jgi:hypothetical protein
MAGIGANKGYWVTAAALSCIGIVLPAWGSPPSSKSASGTAHTQPARLDLRPPTARELGESHRASSDRLSWAAAPQDIPRTTGSRDGNLSAFGHSAFGINAAAARGMGGAEAFVRRFHREGLPVARLWESHSALVSLGLNAKGKPGLWLVQKTH